MRHCNDRVTRELRKRIRKKGKITFKEFMEVALYLKGEGYYSSDRDVWGSNGDYITAPVMSPLFSRMVAKQLYQMWSILGCHDPFYIIEAGAGRSMLSYGVMKTIRDDYASLYSASRFIIIEQNQSLWKEKSDREFHSVSRYRYIDDIGPDIDAACIITNEMLDAFPVHLLQQLSELKEVYICSDGDMFIETLDKPSTEDLLVYLQEEGVSLRENQRVSLNLDAGKWIVKAGGLFNKGFIMTIDYGYSGREYFMPELGDHLVCYHGHSVNFDPLINVGLQDITAHVDFSTLVKSGYRAGLELSGYTSQLYFMLGCGILDELETIEYFDEKGLQGLEKNQQVKSLLMPGGMGDIYKVLIQHKGVDMPRLMGFGFKKLPLYLQ